MKTIAKTTKSIMLIDPQTRDIVEEQPRLVRWTTFLEGRTGRGEIKILASDVPAEAQDEEFQKFLSEAENEELAVASFMSQFEEKPAPKTTTRKVK